MFKRLSGRATALALVLAAALPGLAQAQQFFRIGTGGTAGTYYPVGGMIANAVSQPGKIVVTAQALWLFTLIRQRQRDDCFKAFRLNHWLGFAVFCGVVMDLALRGS